jgi:type II secretory pathway component GspD/PulD (secretin)
MTNSRPFIGKVSDSRVSGSLDPILLLAVLLLATLGFDPRCAQAQDYGELLEQFASGEEQGPVSVVDLLGDETVLSEMKLNNGQRQKVEELVTTWRTNQQQLTEKQEAELDAISDSGERLRRRASQRRELRESSGKWRQETAAALAEALDEQQLSLLEEKLESAGEAGLQPTPLPPGQPQPSEGPSPDGNSSESRPSQGGPLGGRSSDGRSPGNGPQARDQSFSPRRSSKTVASFSPDPPSPSQPGSSQPSPKLPGPVLNRVVQSPSSDSVKASASQQAATQADQPESEKPEVENDAPQTVDSATEANTPAEANTPTPANTPGPRAGDSPVEEAQPSAATAPQPAAPSVGTPSEKDIRVAFNFHEAPWSDVLRLFAESAGLTLHLRETPPGSFTYYDRQSYTPPEALDVMNRYLLQSGYLLVRHDRFLTVVDASKGVPPSLIETVPAEALDARGDTEMLRVMLPLGDREAAKASEEVRALLGPQGTVVPLETANSVVVTDIGSNLRRIRQLLEPPPKVADSEMTFQAFPLQHVDAETAADKVRSLFGIQPGVSNVSGYSSSRGSSRDSGRSRGGFDPREMMRSRFGGGSSDGDNDRSRSQESSSTPGNSSATTKVAVDRRTNSVLVTATAEDMKLVTQVIEAVDISPEEATEFERENLLNEPMLQVYQLESADAQEVAKTLGVLHPGLVVNEDGRARRIHVWATPEQHREIGIHIQQLDGAAGTDSLAVIPLEGMSAYEVNTTLTTLFAGGTEKAPSIANDPSGRGLLVRGSVNQIMQIRSLVSQLATQDPLESQRSVRIVPVRSPSTTFVQETIGTLYPQVTVIKAPQPETKESSGSSSDRRRDSRRSSDSSDEDQERAERIRRFMEMRERFSRDSDSGRGRDR